MIHFPEGFDEITLEYEIVAPEQKQTRKQPGFDMNIEITRVTIFHQELSEYFLMFLLKHQEKIWEIEIIKSLQKG